MYRYSYEFYHSFALVCTLPAGFVADTTSFICFQIHVLYRTAQVCLVALFSVSSIFLCDVLGFSFSGICKISSFEITL